MITLDEGNMLLKPSQRRQLMTWLKRTMRLGERLGDFVLSITLKRTGRIVQIEADVATRRGSVVFGIRQHDWRHAAREIVRRLTVHLHDQLIQPM